MSKSKGYLGGEWQAIDALLNVWWSGWDSPMSTEEMTLRLRYLELVDSMLRTLRAAIKRQRHDPTMLSFCEIVLGTSLASDTSLSQRRTLHVCAAASVYVCVVWCPVLSLTWSLRDVAVCRRQEARVQQQLGAGR